MLDLITALLASFIAPFKTSINSPTPLGSILIFAALRISSTASAPSFLFFQSLSLNKAKSFALSYLLISSRGKESSKLAGAPPAAAISSYASPFNSLEDLNSPFL